MLSSTIAHWIESKLQPESDFSDTRFTLVIPLEGRSDGQIQGYSHVGTLITFGILWSVIWRLALIRFWGLERRPVERNVMERLGRCVSFINGLQFHSHGIHAARSPACRGKMTDRNSEKELGQFQYHVHLDETGAESYLISSALGPKFGTYTGIWDLSKWNIWEPFYG
jgi:hypothetical protein